MMFCIILKILRLQSLIFLIAKAENESRSLIINIGLLLNITCYSVTIHTYHLNCSGTTCKIKE